MGVIKLLKTNCKNCYSCVRACEVNAIRIKNDQAEIVEDRCIHCGICIDVCPRNAKEIKSCVSKVKDFLNSGSITVASVAATYAAAFSKNSCKIVAALKKLGFDYVEETTVGSARVRMEYEKYLAHMDDKCYITSYCPPVNELIEKYYPEVIKNLLPVIPPMECHGRIIKEEYGRDAKVVFITPCLAKKSELEEVDSVDAVITFDELEKWFIDENIDFKSLEDIPFDNKSSYGKGYYVFGETSFQMNNRNFNDKVLYVEGIKECKEVLQKVRHGRFKNIFIDMNICRHGCIDGPAMPKNIPTIYERQIEMKKYIRQATVSINSAEDDILKYDIDMHRNFESKAKSLKKPTFEEIKAILASIGKYTKDDELNCGACGYKTCREKAVAVYNGMAEPTMCLPYMKQKAENFSNVIFDMTPTILLVVDEKLNVLDCNKAAEKFFSLNKGSVIGMPVDGLMSINMVNEAVNSDKNIINRRVYLEKYDATVLESIIRVEKSNIILILMNDFTKALKQEEKLRKMKINAIDMAQEVIDKQMMVAQEIASLLGETTAETKVSLTKLKNLVQGEEVDLK